MGVTQNILYTYHNHHSKFQNSSSPKEKTKGNNKGAIPKAQNFLWVWTLNFHLHPQQSPSSATPTVPSYSKISSPSARLKPPQRRDFHQRIPTCGAFPDQKTFPVPILKNNGRRFLIFPSKPPWLLRAQEISYKDPGWVWEHFSFLSIFIRCSEIQILVVWQPREN